ncbi:Signal peptidase I (plasmid) [Euzebya pacifica]|uniref:Signal peptidase I n=1 Tax=Euzebya pacifica TaxID=1608957 RepID=A0A346Y6K2_9ACTN|nr:signal peptidase I [Euzebya pacifica]AXV10099.1 Signal peptidase I [Euzebya pacifica]
MAVRPPDQTRQLSSSSTASVNKHPPTRSGPGPLPDRGLFAAAAWLASTLWLVAAGLVVVVAVIVVALPGTHLLTVTSGSMSPALDPGDVVIVVAREESLAVGQLATFPDTGRGGLLVTHRVVDHTDVDGQLAYATRGDANQSADPTPVPHSDLVGVVRIVLPDVGRLLPTGPHGPLPGVTALLLTVISVLMVLQYGRRSG